MISPSQEFREIFGSDAVFEGCDFRPLFDGFLWNGARVITPAETRDVHMALVWSYVREMAMWIVGRRDQFPPGDRFQLIVGWPESVRTSARQIVRLGGDFNELRSIAAADTFSVYESNSNRPVFRRNWDLAIYT